MLRNRIAAILVLGCAAGTVTISAPVAAADGGADSHFGRSSDSGVDFGLKQQNKAPKRAGSSGRVPVGGVGRGSVYAVLDNGCSVAVHGAEFALDPLAACLSVVGNGGGPGPARLVDAGALAERAVGRLQLPTPRLGTAPPNRSVVGVATWLWVDRGQWQPISASVSVSGATLRVWATPVQTVWDTGERSRSCNGPGRPWRDGLSAAAGCTYQYQRTSEGQPGGVYRLSVRTRYQVSWACAGNCSQGGGTLGNLDSAPTTRQLPVVELVPVLVR